MERKGSALKGEAWNRTESNVWEQRGSELKDSVAIGCAFSQSRKVTICSFDSILRPEYISEVI